MTKDYKIRVFLKGGANVDITSPCLEVKSASSIKRSAKDIVNRRFGDKWELAIVLIRRYNYYADEEKTDEVRILP